MTPSDPQHFADLPTSWTLLRAAHDPAADPAARTEARRALAERYRGVARRYLGGALRHEPNRAQVVDDLEQEFGVKIMAGKMRNASPEGGRKFRAYVRTVLANLVNEWQRRERRWERPMGDELPEGEYTTIWQEDLVEKALEALKEHERQTGEIRYTVMKLAMDEPGLDGAGLAERLTAALGKAVDAAWVRKRTFLAREKLRELLRREVRQTLDGGTDAEVEEELAAVGLLAYCR